jgi:excisionase family DNA binding protein
MQLIRIQEVAMILDVSLSRAYFLVREGVIPSVRLGRQVRVERTKLEEWLSRGGAELPQRQG